jgi:predicted nucleic acid-binding Zn ribbon protein
LREQRVLSLWEEIVGKDIAAVTKVEGFRGEQLTVSVQNPTWRHWLRFQCETIR